VIEVVTVLLIRPKLGGGYGAAMRTGEGIRVLVYFDVSDHERFEEMATAMVEVSRSEPGTLVYDWYLDADEGKGCLYEAYESHEAIVAHAQGPVFTEIAPKYSDTLKVARVEVFGDAAKLAAGGDVLGAPTTWWGASVAAVAG
jgi:quinol monooxygenase YgiN